MRIGIDTHAAERGGGGNCTYISNLVVALSEIDNENEYVLLATNPKHPFYKQFETRPNFSVRPVTPSPAWWRVFLSISRASYQERLDVIHLQYFAPFLHHGSLVNTIHDVSPFRFPEFYSFYERLIFNLLLPGSSKRTKLVITATSFAREEITEILHIASSKIRVIPHGIEEKFRLPIDNGKQEQTLNKYGIVRPYILTVGRIDPRKNLQRLLEAYRMLHKQHSLPHKLVIAGKHYFLSSDAKSVLESAGEKGEILLPGFVLDEDLPALYQGSEVFIFLSEYEGFGIPPLEAMASGIPVVASDIPVFRETLGDAAILVNPYKIEEISDALYRILSDPVLRNELHQKGKMRAEKFRWKKAAEATLATYREALQSSNGSARGSF